MTKEEQERLAEQVENLDATEKPTNPLAGKKLKSINKKALTQEEEEGLNEFMEKTSSRNMRVVGESQIGSKAEVIDGDPTPISGGWVIMDKSEMGRRAMFYPETWQFKIRPASYDSIKNWNSIDETRKDFQYTANQVFNEIVKSSVSIQTPTGTLNWQHLNAWDRFFFILEARKYSFANTSRIEFTERCEYCDEEVTYTLTPENLYYEFPDEEVINKHWDVDELCWKINPADYDMSGSVIKLYVPTLGKNDAILQWAYAQAQNGKPVKEAFAKFLPWMLKSAPKDFKLLDKAIKECERQYKSWDLEMFDFMDEIIRNIEISPEDRISSICPDCGAEVHSTIQFQNGTKSLFAVESGRKRFGSK